MNAPNRITLTRIALIPALAVCAAQAEEIPALRWVALGIFVAALVGDVLDGWVARRWGQVTRLGAFLDPLADKLLIATLFVCLALPLWPGPLGLPRRLLPPWVAVVVISRDLYISLGSLLVYMATGSLHVKPSVFGKAATASFAATGLSALAGFPGPVRAATAWISVALAAVTWIQYTIDGRRQIASQEPR